MLTSAEAVYTVHEPTITAARPTSDSTQTGGQGASGLTSEGTKKRWRRQNISTGPSEILQGLPDRDNVRGDGGGGGGGGEVVVVDVSEARGVLGKWFDDGGIYDIYVL